MHTKLKDRAGLAMAAALMACLGLMTPSSLAAAASPPIPTSITSCSSSSSATHPLIVVVAGQRATGLYALPSGPARGIVVVGHGHTGNAHDEAGLVQQIARSDQVIALAMDYRGTNPTTRFGWRVIEGAQDSIAATELFDQSCPGSASFTNVVLGISMGGNMSGLAVSSGARRHDGAPLYDYWFDVAGVTNVPQIYADVQAISVVPGTPLSSTGTTAMTEMQQEFGGTPLSNPMAYLANSPVLRTAAMKASGIKGVIISHGVIDGEVTSDMSDQMALALALSGIPVHLYTSVFKAPDTSSGLTFDGYLVGVVPSYSSPFAGHVSEVVLQSSLDKLHDIYLGGFPPNGTSLTLVDGLLGVQPVFTLPRLFVPYP